MRIKNYIFATALLILIGIAINIYLSQDERSCKATGGEWIIAGAAQQFICVHKYSDGGKPCSSSAECEGSCISKDDGTGYCKTDDNPFGCYRTIEDFREGVPALCTD